MAKPMPKEYKVVYDGLTEVGDIITIKTSWTGNSRYRVTRVTKTLSKSLRVSDGYEYTFKREISGDMAKPYQRYSTNTYTVRREVKDDS